MGFNFDRPYNEKCSQCEHGKDRHVRGKYVCFAQDSDGYECNCDQFERKKEVKTPQQTRSEEILRMAKEQEFGMGSDGVCIAATTYKEGANLTQGSTRVKHVVRTRYTGQLNWY